MNLTDAEMKIDQENIVRHGRRMGDAWVIEDADVIRVYRPKAYTQQVILSRILNGCNVTLVLVAAGFAAIHPDTINLVISFSSILIYFFVFYRFSLYSLSSVWCCFLPESIIIHRDGGPWVQDIRIDSSYSNLEMIGFRLTTGVLLLELLCSGHKIVVTKVLNSSSHKNDIEVLKNFLAKINARRKEPEMTPTSFS
jgi:hypothetical protein